MGKSNRDKEESKQYSKKKPKHAKMEPYKRKKYGE